jgi:hypothetical protein
VADVADKFLARAFQPFQTREVVKDEHRPQPAALHARDGGRIHLQPAFRIAGQFQFVIHHPALLLRARDNLRDCMGAHRLQHGLTAQGAHGGKHLGERAVGKLHPVRLVQYQHSFDHAVEERVLSRPRLGDRDHFEIRAPGQFAPPSPALALKPPAPPELQGGQQGE